MSTGIPAPHGAGRARRSQGGAAVGALLLLLVAAIALGGNYVRNYQIDRQEEETARPYASYRVADLEALAEGYRMELRAAEKRYQGSRIQTRERHHFQDQVAEFERVQREARKARDKAYDVASIQTQLADVEAELARREQAGSGMAMHLERMLRL